VRYLGTGVAEIHHAKPCHALPEGTVVSKRLLLISVQLVIAVAASTAEASASAGDQWVYPPPYVPYYRYAAPDSSVRLEIKPKQAEVFVDGYYAGVVDDFDGTFQRLRLPPGEHEIEVYLNGYHTFRERVLLTPDNTLKIKHEMEKLGPNDQPEPRPQPIPPPPQTGGAAPRQPGYMPGRPPQGRQTPQPPAPTAPPDTRESRPPESGALGSLALHLQPSDAEVIVDGQRWLGPAGQDRPAIELSEGRHTIEIRKPGYRTYVTDVDIKRGETTQLEVSLRSQGE
jgi:hypothetical protein